MMTSHLSLQGQRKRFIMSDTSRRGADRACRQSDGMPSFVERLDAIDLATAARLELPPVVISAGAVPPRNVKARCAPSPEARTLNALKLETSATICANAGS